MAVRPQPAEPTTYPSMANSTAGSTGSLPPGFGLPLPAVAPAAAATPLAAQLELRRVQSWGSHAAGSGKHPPHLDCSGDSAWMESQQAASEEEGGEPAKVPPASLAELRTSLLARVQRTCHVRRLQGLLSAEVRRQQDAALEPCCLHFCCGFVAPYLSYLRVDVCSLLFPYLI